MIFIRGSSTHVLVCQGDESFAELKQRIANLEDFPIEDIRIYADSRPVEDGCCVGDYQGIEITIGLLGGKVHGSLARAGKVRGQTPKVDKQEKKKKKKTGRAKKRSQYNKRFVNGVSVYGPGNGPNSNKLQL